MTYKEELIKAIECLEQRIEDEQVELYEKFGAFTSPYLEELKCRKMGAEAQLDNYKG